MDDAFSRLEEKHPDALLIGGDTFFNARSARSWPHTAYGRRCPRFSTLGSSLRMEA